MKGLSAFYAGKSSSLQVKELLHQVEILFGKNLYDHCLGLLKKAKRKARKYELYPLMMEISLWERKTMEKLSNINGVKEALDEAMKDMGLLDNMNAFMMLYYRSIERRRKVARSRSKANLAELETFIQHPFLQNDEIPLTFQARLHFWRIFSNYYYSTQNREKEEEANQKLLHLMDTREDYAEEYPAEYVSIFSRLLVLKRQAPIEEYFAVLSDFKAFPSRLKKSKHSIQKSIQIRVDIDSSSIEMSRLLEQGYIPNAMEMVAKMSELHALHKRRMSISQKMEYRYMYAYAYLANEHYRPALKEVNHLLNEFDERERPDLHLYSRMLSMIIHTELQNLTVLKYEADSTARFLQRRGPIHQSESILIRFFRRMSRISIVKPEMRMKVLKQYHAELAKMYEDEHERKSLFYFDFLTWMESRIKKVPFWQAKLDKTEGVLESVS